VWPGRCDGQDNTSHQCGAVNVQKPKKDAVDLIGSKERMK